MRKSFLTLSLIILAAWAYSPAPANAEIFTETDISYGADPLQKLDIYAPSGLKALKPVLIYIHGGGWQIGDKSIGQEHGTFYAGEGAVFVSINYRLSPKDKHLAQAQDSAAAVKWVYDNIRDFGGNKEQIHIAGHSAGAHLAALIATDSKYLNAHALSPTLFKTVFPIDTASFDFSVPLEKWRRFVQPKIDATFGTSAEQIKEASPISYVAGNKSLPPFISFVTSNRPDAVKQTQDFSAALNQAGGKSEAVVIDGLTHREMNQAMYDTNSKIAKNIITTLWPE